MRAVTFAADGGIAVIPPQPSRYFLRSLCGVVTLEAQPATKAVVEIVIEATGDFNVTFQDTSAGLNSTFAFAGVDPGGGVVWIDNAGLATVNDYAAALDLAASGVGFDAAQNGNAVVVTALTAGAQTVTITSTAGFELIPPSGVVVGHLAAQDDLQVLLCYSYGKTAGFAKSPAPKIEPNAANAREGIVTFGVSVQTLNEVDTLDSDRFYVATALPDGILVDAATQVFVMVNCASGFNLANLCAVVEDEWW